MVATTGTTGRYGTYVEEDYENTFVDAKSRDPIELDCPMFDVNGENVHPNILQIVDDANWTGEEPRRPKYRSLDADWEV